MLEQTQFEKLLENVNFQALNILDVDLRTVNLVAYTDRSRALVSVECFLQK